MQDVGKNNTFSFDLKVCHSGGNFDSTLNILLHKVEENKTNPGGMRF